MSARLNRALALGFVALAFVGIVLDLAGIKSIDPAVVIGALIMADLRLALARLEETGR